MDERRDCATQVQQRVQLHRCLGRAKGGPVEQGEAQVDGGGIQRVDRVGQFQPQIVVSVESARTPNQQGRDIGPQAPIARLVGIGQGGTVNRVAQAHRIAFVGMGTQGDLDVAQTLAPGQLCKRHDAKLFGTIQAPHAGIAAIPIHNARKTRPRNKLHDLCKWP